jgi:hypothetical protein
LILVFAGGAVLVFTKLRVKLHFALLAKSHTSKEFLNFFVILLCIFAYFQRDSPSQAIVIGVDFVLAAINFATRIQAHNFEFRLSQRARLISQQKVNLGQVVDDVLVTDADLRHFLQVRRLSQGSFRLNLLKLQVFQHLHSNDNRNRNHVTEQDYVEQDLLQVAFEGLFMRYGTFGQLFEVFVE